MSAQLVEQMVRSVAGGADPTRAAHTLNEGDGSPLGYGVSALKAEIAAGKLEGSRAACEDWLRRNMPWVDQQFRDLILGDLKSKNIVQEIEPSEEAEVVEHQKQFRLRVGNRLFENRFTTQQAATDFASDAGLTLKSSSRPAALQEAIVGTRNAAPISDIKARLRAIAKKDSARRDTINLLLNKLDRYFFELWMSNIEWLRWSRDITSSDPRVDLDISWEQIRDDRGQTRESRVTGPAKISKTIQASVVTEGRRSQPMLVPADTAGVVESRLPRGFITFVVDEKADKSLAGKTLVIAESQLQRKPVDESSTFELRDRTGYGKVQKLIMRDGQLVGYVLLGGRAKDDPSAKWGAFFGTNPALRSGKATAWGETPEEALKLLVSRGVPDIAPAAGAELTEFVFFDASGSRLGAAQSASERGALGTLLAEGLELQNVDLGRTDRRPIRESRLIEAEEYPTWARLLKRGEGTPDGQRARVLADLNYQVQNGGFEQWVDNGFGGSLKDAQRALQWVGTRDARKASDMLGVLSQYIDLNAKRRGFTFSSSYWTDEEEGREQADDLDRQYYGLRSLQQDIEAAFANVRQGRIDQGAPGGVIEGAAGRWLAKQCPYCNSMSAESNGDGNRRCMDCDEEWEIEARTGRPVAIGTVRGRAQYLDGRDESTTGRRSRNEAEDKRLSQLRQLAQRAASLRLKGQIQSANTLDNQIDRLASALEDDGLGDEAVSAEEEGRQAGGVNERATGKRVNR